MWRSFGEAGFSTSDRCYLRPRSFDLAARRDDQFLFLKILSNIDGLNERLPWRSGVWPSTY